MSESKGVRGVAFYHGAVTRSSGRKRGADAVEAKIDPRSQEAEPGQEHGRLRAEGYARYGVGEEEYGGEMFHTHTYDAFCDCNGMLGDELLEGNEEASLNGNATGDCGGAAWNVSVGTALSRGLTYSVRSFLERAYPTT